MRACYRDVLGLNLLTDVQDPVWAEFEAGGARFALHAIPATIADSISIAEPPAAREDSPIKLAFAVADLEAERSRLVARGVTMFPLQSWGACDGLDPEGNVFQLVGKARVLVLPGLFNSGPEHWQSRWEAAHRDFERVLQDDWDTPRCADWVARLDEALGRTPDSVLVAHSSACALVGHWARSGSQHRVRGALLVGPSDTEAPSYPSGPVGFDPMPLARLPFPSIVVASTDDPYVSLERAAVFASAWGSRLHVVKGGGHLNSTSGLGDWPEGLSLLDELR